MKRTLCICAAFLLLVREPLPLNEKVVVWERIYRRQHGPTAYRRSAQDNKGAEGQGLHALLVSALDQLVKRNLETGSPTERAQKNQLSPRLLVQIGNLKSAEAADGLQDCMRKPRSPCSGENPPSRSERCGRRNTHRASRRISRRSTSRRSPPRAEAGRSSLSEPCRD